MQWELNSDKPLYLQIVEQIQAEIISGNYKPGDKLPSVRDLAVQATVNPNTMQKAMSELERIGLVYANRTSGRFITSDEAMVKQLKEEAVRRQIFDFFDRMKQLGFSQDETYELITNLLKKDS
ncbi:MAG TPA: GntR family transcriptional regulator [Mobilitalea sp.]|nr:GntR family transcriptional regulator [Mobilitalea sp.]